MLTKRSYSQWLAPFTFAALLAACSPQAATTSTAAGPTAAPTLVNTETPTPVPTIKVDGLQLPDPRVTNPELFDLNNPDSPIVQFANAFGVAPEEVGELTPHVKSAADGSQFVVLVTGDLGQTTTYDESGTPLIIAKQGENGEWNWSEITLQNAKEYSPFEILGVLLSPDMPEAVELETSEFDLGAITFSWNDHVNQNGDINFSWSDRQYREASSAGMDTIFQHILFANDTPEWIDKLSTDEVKALMEKVITGVMTHYKDKVNYFVVVNEPFVSPYRTRDPFYKAFDNSYEYIEYAFSLARKTNPDAFLIYNDSGNHSGNSSSANGLTTNLTSEIINDLRNKDLVDGVGVQMHIDASKPPSEEDITATLNSYEIPVLITELDVDMSNVAGSQEEKILLQTSIYQTIIRAAKSSNCISITLWGIGDKNSWLEKNGKLEADPTIFDDNLQPKAAYFGVLQELINS